MTAQERRKHFFDLVVLARRTAKEIVKTRKPEDIALWKETVAKIDAEIERAEAIMAQQGSK